MTDTASILSGLRRPRLLIRAAHLALDTYDRERALRRLLPEARTRAGAETLAVFMELESALDGIRRDGGGVYSPARHIELLAAIIVEARFVARQAA